MLVLKRKTIEQGVNATTQNARQMLQAADLLRQNGEPAIFYSGVLYHTALEELAKASYLFEKYLYSIKNDKAPIPPNERKKWLGGRQAHTQRTSRVQFLFALKEQMGIPGMRIQFPQGVADLTNNRNSSLYVDYIDQENKFVGPSEVFSPQYMTANPGFAREILAYAQYDVAIEIISKKLIKSSRRRKDFAELIFSELNIMGTELIKEIDSIKDSHDMHIPFTSILEPIICAKPISNNEISLIYTIAMGTENNMLFYMNNYPNQAHIYEDGKVKHYEIKNDPQGLLKKAKSSGGIVTTQWGPIRKNKSL